MGNFNPKLPTKYSGTNKYITFFVTRDRSPTGADYRQPETGTLYSVGTVWQVGKNPTTGSQGDLWMLSKIVANVGYWVQISSGVTPTGGVLTLSDTANTLVFPTVGGNIQLIGTAGQITVTSDAINNKLIFSLAGAGTAVDSFTVQSITAPGVNPVTPTALGVVTVNGAVVANHSVVLETRSRALNAYNLEVQYATTAAATDGTKSGVAHFDSARFTADATGFISLNGSGVGETITGQSGGALSPTAGNWNISGLGETVTSGAVSTLSIFSPRAYKYIIDPTLNNGTFQTFTAAVAGTSAGDIIFVRPGTYTENVVLTGTRYFVASVSQSQTTTLVGKVSDGGVTLTGYFQNIQLKNNGDYGIESTGASSVFVLSGCNLRAVNNTAVNLNHAGATLMMSNGVGNIETTGIGLWTSIGSIIVDNCVFDNTGLSTTASTNSGNTLITNSYFNSPIQCSSIGVIKLQNSYMNTLTTNTAPVVITGSGTSNVFNSTIEAGTASSITIATGASCQVANVQCKSSNTNVLTGAGTLFYGGIVFTGSSNGHNVSTETALSLLG